MNIWISQQPLSDNSKADELQSIILGTDLLYNSKNVENRGTELCFYICFWHDFCFIFFFISLDLISHSNQYMTLEENS